jgi:hypothetical protein
MNTGTNDELLKDACDNVINDNSLAPVIQGGKIVETHCNEGAQRIANALGCHELDDMMADDQHRVMSDNASGLWEKVDGQDAALWALDGKLAFAAMSSTALGEAHGHIAAIYPAARQFSGSLDMDVPMVANIGKSDCEERVSQAFPPSKGEPDYFVWRG